MIYGYVWSHRPHRIPIKFAGSSGSILLQEICSKVGLVELKEYLLGQYNIIL